MQCVLAVPFKVTVVLRSCMDSMLRLPGKPALSCRLTQLYSEVRVVESRVGTVVGWVSECASEGAVLYMYLAIAVGNLAPDAALK
eukprot:1633025-Amphidinium_carterae.1